MIVCFSPSSSCLAACEIVRDGSEEVACPSGVRVCVSLASAGTIWGPWTCGLLHHAALPYQAKHPKSCDCLSSGVISSQTAASLIELLFALQRRQNDTFKTESSGRILRATAVCHHQFRIHDWSTPLLSVRYGTRRGHSDQCASEYDEDAKVARSKHSDMSYRRKIRHLDPKQRTELGTGEWYVMLNEDMPQVRSALVLLYLYSTLSFMEPNADICVI